MSTKIHKNVHESSQKVSTKSHPFCPQKFALYVLEKSTNQFAKKSSTSMPFHYRGYLVPLPSYSFARKIDSPSGCLFLSKWCRVVKFTQMCLVRIGFKESRFKLSWCFEWDSWNGKTCPPCYMQGSDPMPRLCT